MKCKYCKEEGEKVSCHSVTIRQYYSPDKIVYSRENQWYCLSCKSSWYTPADSYKVFSIKELNEFKAGTVIDHKTLGKGIVLGKNKTRVVFKNHLFDYEIAEGYPWNYPIKIIEVK